MQFYGALVFLDYTEGGRETEREALENVAFELNARFPSVDERPAVGEVDFQCDGKYLAAAWLDWHFVEHQLMRGFFF